MVVDGTLDSERNTLEPPEADEDDEDADSERDLFCPIRETASREDEVIQ